MVIKNKVSGGKVLSMTLLVATLFSFNTDVFASAAELNNKNEKQITVVTEDGDVAVSNIVLEIDESKQNDNVDAELADKNQHEKIQVLAAIIVEQEKVKEEIEEQKRLEAERIAKERAEQERIAREKEEAKKRAEQAEKEKKAKQQAQKKKSNSNSGWITVTSTAYSSQCDGCSGFTYTGKDIRSGHHKVIAVDPTVIPLGSLVEIQGLGVYQALDVGSAIKGHKIDILKPNKDSAIAYGMKSTKIKIVRRGF